MKCWATISCSWFKVALLALGVVLPFCVPDQAEARCGSHHAWLYSSISQQHLVTESAASSGTIFLSSFTVAKPRSLKFQLNIALRSFFQNVGITTQGAACGQCPLGSLPGNRCEGPHCSNNAPPATSGSILQYEGRVTDLFFYFNHFNLKGDSRRYSVVTVQVHTCDCLDTIFHPPRIN